MLVTVVGELDKLGGEGLEYIVDTSPEDTFGDAEECDEAEGEVEEKKFELTGPTCLDARYEGVNGSSYIEGLTGGDRSPAEPRLTHPIDKALGRRECMRFFIMTGTVLMCDRTSWF